MKEKLINRHEKLLNFIKNNNKNITFGIVFSPEDGRKHIIWCGSEEKCAFRIKLKR